jgi:hypothetical protein
MLDDAKRAVTKYPPAPSTFPSHNDAVFYKDSLTEAVSPDLSIFPRLFDLRFIDRLLRVLGKPSRVNQLLLRHSLPDVSLHNSGYRLSIVVFCHQFGKFCFPKDPFPTPPKQTCSDP